MRAPSEHLPSENIVRTTPTTATAPANATGRLRMVGSGRPVLTIVAGVAGTAPTGRTARALSTDVQSDGSWCIHSTVEPGVSRTSTALASRVDVSPRPWLLGLSTT